MDSPKVSPKHSSEEARASRGAGFGWLVLTAANERQAAAYSAQLAARVGRGALAGAQGAFAVADARGVRIGSGSATVLALAEVARRLVKTKRAVSLESSLEALLAGERILILHSGGESRRLPMYAVEGKLFAPVPKRGRCDARVKVLDLMLEDLATLAPRAGGEVLVGAGDALLGLARSPVRLAGSGVIGVAQHASVERASRHGVFVRGRGDAVAAYLQKPDEAAMRAAGALDASGRALLDLGLFSFDPPSAAALLAGAGVRLSRGRIVFTRDGLADRASRALLSPVDLYREIAMALPARTRRTAYLRACGVGAGGDARDELARPLGTLFDAMRSTDFRVAVTSAREPSSEFLHIGSTREMLDACCGRQAALARFGVAPHGDACVVLDARPPAARARGRAVVDTCDARRLALGGDNIVASITGTLEGALPRGVSVFGVPLRGGGEAIVACHVDDDFKTPLANGGTVLGRDARSFDGAARRLGRAWIEGDGTLWDARLWPKADPRDALALVRWMWEGTAAPEHWKRARRWTMRELAAQADAGALTLLRARFAGDAHSAEAAPTALGRARASAIAAELQGVGTRAGAALRRRAFDAVGEAVLAQVKLPTRPARATILHDQAVWTSMPVRVDLAGGWSDTPPICNEAGGSVVNVALMLRGQLPVQVVAKLEDEPVIRITSTDLGRTVEIRDMAALARRSDPSRWSSLAENALVLTGAAPADPKASLAKWLDAVGGGISLTLFSAVPKGSGLGTSSILGAATIHALDRVFGRVRTQAEFFAATSALEQMLGSRGGWQDQIGGVVGGFKLAHTAPGAVQRPRVEPIAVPTHMMDELAARSVLYFTGERRMARNILENVVWNWLVREPTAVDAVARLRANALRMRAALAAGDMPAVLAELDEYRACKRQIDPGSCPAWLDDCMDRWRDELASWCFAGAGGGGFLLLIARNRAAARRLARRIESDPPHPRARAFAFEVDPRGLRCAVL